MKFSCTQENLKKGLTNITSISGKNINLPILSNVLIKASENNIKLSATDLEIGATCLIRGKVEEKGEFTVNAKLLFDYINLLPNNRIDFELIDNELNIKSDQYKTKIKGESSEDFPIIPEIEKKIGFIFDLEEFKKTLNKTVFAAARDETRIELSGVYFEFQKDEVVVAATDSYRLAEKKIKYKTKEYSGDEIKKVIIPTKTLQEIIKISSPENEFEDKNQKNNSEVKIFISENQVLFKINGVEVVSRIIEGQYPDYKQIIPNQEENNKTIVVINNRDFIRAIKASSLFSKKNINDINLDFPIAGKKAVVSAVSGQEGESVVEVLADIKGKDNGVVLNYRYLLEGLNSIEDDEVLLEIIDFNTPFLLKNKNDDDCLYIIMPIKQ